MGGEKCRSSVPARAGELEAVLGCLKVVRGPDARGEYTAWCPFHPDGQGDPPHRPNLRVSERGYICHACGRMNGRRWRRC